MKLTMKLKPSPRLEELYPLIEEELKNEGYIKPKPMPESKTMALLSSCIVPIALLGFGVAIVTCILIPS